MRETETEAPSLEPENRPGWSEHAGRVLRAAAALLATRNAIFRAELAEKGALLSRALLLLTAAAAFGLLALFLATALVAAVLTSLFGSALAGILATLLLYAAAGGAAFLGARRLFSRVKPLEFAVTREEIRKDWESLEPPGMEEASSSSAPGPRAEEPEDLEERFRAGSE